MIQKYNLALVPTPVEHLKNLSTYLQGHQIFIKRDDLTGLAFGGNKTRKLEYLIADAIQKGADTILTVGAIQSNHTRQTAAAANKAGLHCELLLKGQPPSTPNGNLLLDQLMNVKIHWTQKTNADPVLLEISNQLKKEGKKPYIIPLGGSNAIGALGYVDAMIELNDQLKKFKNSFNHIVLATSSGGTQAGIVVGAKIANFTGKIHGIWISKDETLPYSFEKHLSILAEETSKLLGRDLQFSENDFIVNKNYFGKGYAILGNLEKNAIKIMAEKEGIFLDPVYTGRAFGGLLDMIKKGELKKDETVLFWHTGGTPALFAYANELNIGK